MGTAAERLASQIATLSITLEKSGESITELATRNESAASRIDDTFRDLTESSTSLSTVYREIGTELRSLSGDISTSTAEGISAYKTLAECITAVSQNLSRLEESSESLQRTISDLAAMAPDVSDFNTMISGMSEEFRRLNEGLQFTTHTLQKEFTSLIKSFDDVKESPKEFAAAMGNGLKAIDEQLVQLRARTEASALLYERLAQTILESADYVSDQLKDS